MKLSLMYYPDDPADEIIKIIKTTDELGFHACYLTDSSLRRDLWTLLGAAAVQTKRVRLGANAVRIGFRDPALIALAIATLDELSAGRTDTVVCFGGRRFWHQHALEPARTTRPWARVREAIQVIETFLGSSRLDFEGEYFRYNALEASMLPLTRPAPVHLASSGGPRAMRAAGEIADGMHIAPACSRRACETATAMVSEGARRAGRDPQNLDIALCPIWVCSSDAEAARRVARIKTSWYLPSLPASCLELHGISPEAIRPIREAWSAGDVRKAIECTTTDITERLSIAGTPRECLKKLQTNVAGTGVGHLVVMVADPAHAKLISGQSVSGVPSIREQLRLIHDHVQGEIADW